MNILRLGGGPTLKLYTDWETEPAEVTDQAHHYLWEPVSVQSSLKVGDIFRLLRICPPLIEIFARWYAKDFLEHVEKGNEGWKDGFPPSERIEFLRLSLQWYADKKTGHIECSDKMCLSGVSIVQNNQKINHHMSSGNRINFKISDDIVNYLDLPLLVDCEVELYGVTPAAGVKVKSEKLVRDDVQLGEILESFFYGISFFGPPHRKRENDTLRQEMLEKEMSEMTNCSSTDYLAKIQQQEKFTKMFLDASCREIFKRLGGIESNIISEAIWKIDDDQIAETSLDKKFDGKISLKKKYREIDGKSLRKIFSEIVKKLENQFGRQE